MKRIGRGWRSWVLAGLVVVALVAAPAWLSACASLPSQLTGRVVDQQGQPVAEARVFGEFDLGEETFDRTAAEIPTATTDQDGQFRFTWADLKSGRGEPTLWVYRSGYRLARGMVAAGEPETPIRITLFPEVVPAAATVQVLGPHGEPIEQARIIPTRWFEADLGVNSARVWTIPGPVGALLAGQTNAEGRATLAAVPALRLSAVRVESALGTQLVGWDETLTARYHALKLRPVGRVTGQVKGEDRSQGANLRVQIITTVKEQVVGLAEMVTDPAGRFDAPKVVSGQVEVRVYPRPGTMDLAERSLHRPLEAGGTLTADLTLRRGVQVGGMIRDRTEGSPIPGAWVEVSGPLDQPHECVQTDANGRFTVIRLAGRIGVEVIAAPQPFLVPLPTLRTDPIEVPDAIAGFEWPLIALDRGTNIRGRLVDAAGHPAEAGTIVEARWSRRDGRTQLEQVALTATRPGGDFMVGPIEPVANVEVAARRTNHQGGASQVVEAAQLAEPIVLQIPAPVASWQPEGRVVDSAGQPIGGALVQLRVADPSHSAHGPRAGRRIASDGSDAIVTDPTGHYRASIRLDARHRYIAAVEAPDSRHGRTPVVATHQNSRSTLQFPDIVLDRFPTGPAITGRVNTTDGRPIEGVLVHAGGQHRAQTDAHGWFWLEATGHKPSFLFARLAGYRAAGAILSANDPEASSAVTLTLERVDESRVDRSPSDPLAGPLGRGIEAILVRSLLMEPLIERILAQKDPLSTTIVLEHLAESCPGRVLAWINAGVMPNSKVADGLRRVASRSLARQGFAAAEPAIDAIQDRATRTQARLDALKADPALDPAQRRIQIERSEREAYLVAEPYPRAILLARVADLWIDAGDPDRSQLCLGEAQRLAGSLPRATLGAQAWCALIEPMARIDPKLARTRVDRMTDPREADQCRVVIALRSTRLDPSGAVRVFGQIRDHRLLVRSTPEFCHQLAAIDLALARGVALSIQKTNPAEAAYAMGMISAGLIATDRAMAQTVLHEAFTRLEAVARSDPRPKPDEGMEAGLVAATLLPVVQAIDPSLVPEFVWRTLELYPLRSMPDARADALIALLVDRYDRTAARLLFDPTRVNRLMVPVADLPLILLAGLRVNPASILDWNKTPLENNGSPTSLIDQYPLELIAAWSLADHERWRVVTHNHLNLWCP